MSIFVIVCFNEHEVIMQPMRFESCLSCQNKTLVRASTRKRLNRTDRPIKLGFYPAYYSIVSNLDEWVARDIPPGKVKNRHEGC